MPDAPVLSVSDGTDDSLPVNVADDIVPWIDLIKGRNISPQLVVHSNDSVAYPPLERRLQVPLQMLHASGGDNE